MRLICLFLLGLFNVFAQGGGGVQFRDWTKPLPTTAPAIACTELLSLTNFELSVITATVIPSTASVPEHCRVRVMVQPEINIEVNLPDKWNNRLYMFGNGGWAGESFESPGESPTAHAA